MSGEVVHRLGVFLGVLAGAGLLARRWAAARRDRRTRRRLAALMTGVRARDGGAWAPVRERARRWAPPVAVAGAGWVLVGGVPGLVTGLAAAVALRWWRARRTAGGPRRVTRVRRRTDCPW
ncbi:hypothetical protein GA0115242_147673, partial [Streptomyces sp. SolWspMP-5a-2]